MPGTINKSLLGPRAERGPEQAELWTPIFGYVGTYSVSTLGRVRRDRRGRRTYVGRILKSASNSHGYHQVTLYYEGQRQQIKVHKLVMEHFVGAANRLEVNHKDKNKNNNALENLEYVTRLDNMRHSFRHPSGRNIARGEASGTAKLTFEQVAEIRTSSEPSRVLAQRYNVHRNTVWHIRSDRNWRHA